MISEKKWFKAILKIADVYNSIINFICVVLLTAQTVSVLIMVVGRYVFSNVPQWTEQFALFCMTWFAMFSIALGVRDDSHVKMEVIDRLLSERSLRFVKLFGSICTAIFGFVMVRYGLGLTKLTWPTRMSVFPVPQGLKYFSAVAGGFFMITNAAVFSIELFVQYHDKKIAKEVAR